MSHPEAVTRRRLPHWYVPGAVHFITYRLAGTIPVGVLRDLQQWYEKQVGSPSPASTQAGRQCEQAQKQYFRRFDDYLDRNRERDWLARPAAAALVRQNLIHHHGSLYHLFAYCVMPNHVHVLVQPKDDSAGGKHDPRSPLTRVVHSLKSYSANRLNRLLNRTGPLWQPESYDHWARDEAEVGRIVEYIALNPVNAGLVDRPHDWPWCSAHDRFLFDGSECGWFPGTLEGDECP